MKGAARIKFQHRPEMLHPGMPILIRQGNVMAFGVVFDVEYLRVNNWGST